MLIISGFVTTVATDKGSISPWWLSDGLRAEIPSSDLILQELAYASGKKGDRNVLAVDAQDYLPRFPGLLARLYLSQHVERIVGMFAGNAQAPLVAQMMVEGIDRLMVSAARIARGVEESKPPTQYHRGYYNFLERSGCTPTEWVNTRPDQLPRILGAQPVFIAVGGRLRR